MLVIWMEKIIYNYKLVRRFRKTWFWYSSYFFLFASFFTTSANFRETNSYFMKLLILAVLYFSYFFWNLLSLLRIQASIQISLPKLPWFGLRPKSLLSIYQYKRYETTVFYLSFTTFIWLFILLPKQFDLFLIACFFLLHGFRFIYFVKIIFVQQSTDWVKYEGFGLSIYQTDSFQESPTFTPIQK